MLQVELNDIVVNSWRRAETYRPDRRVLAPFEVAFAILGRFAQRVEGGCPRRICAMPSFQVRKLEAGLPIKLGRSQGLGIEHLQRARYRVAESIIVECDPL